MTRVIDPKIQLTVILHTRLDGEQSQIELARLGVDLKFEHIKSVVCSPVINNTT